MKHAEISEQPCWYCIRTKPKHEHIASARLRKLEGVEMFGPQLRFKRSTKRGPCWFVEAMFPGYIFGKFVFALHYRQIQAVNGVTGIVRFGQQYAVMPDSIIAELRKHAGSEETIIIASAVVAGDEVRVATGPFAGVSAMVTQAPPAKERIRILLELLGQQVEAEVDRDAVVGKRQHPLARPSP
jgi:transcriptional antiterminator RfaH